MAEIRNQTLSGDQSIDGNVYIGCDFRNARLIFESGQPPVFTDCGFTDSEFVLQEAAGRTLAFLRAMSPARTGMRGVVAGLMPELGITA